MSNFKYTAGLNNVGSYQVSAVPYITASATIDNGTTVKISFPYVTSWVQVRNTDSTKSLIVALSEEQCDSSKTNNLSLANGTSTGVYDWKITELYFTGSSNGCTFEVAAGLTYLPIERVNNVSPSGSNWSGSIGVG